MLSPWLHATFGRPVHRVALDAGSSCPNRDGTRGWGGCVYCDVEGSGTGAMRSKIELGEQLERGIERVRRRDAATGVIAYFQSYTNTYVERARFEEMLAVVEPHLGEPVVAVSIATRPDCLPEWALARMSELSRRVPVWVELGLEAASDEVLHAIHRLHTVEEFRDAVRRTKQHGLLTVGHAILGLPGDGRAGARRTASVLAETGVDGVKVHQLMVLARTQLAVSWRRGEVEVLEERSYVEWLADFVERLRPDQVLHRLSGDALPGECLAPDWELTTNAVRARLTEEMNRRGTSQGSARGSLLAASDPTGDLVRVQDPTAGGALDEVDPARQPHD